MNQMQQMAHLLAANFETLVYIGSAWWIGRYLNEHQPQSFNWFSVTYLLGLLLIVRSWYLVVRSFLKSQKTDRVSKKDSQDEKAP